MNFRDDQLGRLRRQWTMLSSKFRVIRSDPALNMSRIFKADVAKPVALAATPVGLLLINRRRLLPCLEGKEP